MVMEVRPCPHCGKPVEHYRNPLPTVDIVIFAPDRGVVLVKRKNEPHGWALPGGFVDYGEATETAAVREAKEETGLDVILTRLLGVYSDPSRDPRHHSLSAVYVGLPKDASALAAGDDAAEARFFALGQWPEPVVFDHLRILEDFTRGLRELNADIR